MTGFGRGTHATDKWSANVEASSINRKQVEIVVNLPRPLQSLEARIRKITLPYVSRGRVQLSIQLEKPDSAEATGIRINTALAKSLESAFTELSKNIGRQIQPSASDFMRHPGILETGDSDKVDPEEAWEAIKPALEDAMKNLHEMRSTEGEHLKEDFIRRMAKLVEFTGEIREHAPSRPLRQRDLLEKRLADMEIKIDGDDERLNKELALFADRCDISEELTRLESHFSKFQDYLDSEEASGRHLDFLCQELFREFNTIGSKANDALIGQTVVEAKTELEKIREQIQNIE